MNSEIVFAVLLVTLLILLLIAGVALVFFIAGRQRIRQQVVLAETRLAFEKELRTVETEVTETTMAQLSQELHDNIGQLLTALHIQMENLKLDHPSLSESFKPSENYISTIDQQLRLLSRTLNHDFIGSIGLLGALKTEAERIRNLKRMNVHFEEQNGISNLEKNQELMVFRIFQEIIQNALRHSGANNLTIKVDNGNGKFSLKVSDDGKGFDAQNVIHSSKANGLRNIQKRAALIDMQLEIISKKGQGTLFVIKN